ncbi:MAG: NADH-quinone oxidoreductase subunit M [Chloroflexi bacterium]|nr:NADH-quinone oxidoreductase subunit M [Chloroflexota bacterium]MDA1240017.1 NADH-quinone oxidoreductase subunit M [Chloroflexota bacterium]MQC18961.1 NADH-quinone oxidoreductase subunit M [Chloroflexota bacterium]MQC48299.1 NADH-quinone oxidoreductase subunit M [Chloroflexota bacterium]
MTESDGYVLLALFLVPLGTAALLMLVPSRERAVIIGVTALASLAMLVLSLYVFFSYSFTEGQQFQGVLAFPWMENMGVLGANGIQMKVGVDGVTATLVLLTGVVILPGTWVSWKIQYRLKDFFVLLYILVAGVFGVFVILDLFFWFLAYEVALLPMYQLIAIWGSTRKEYGAMKLMMMLMAGSIFIFAVIFALFTHVGAGTFDMEVLINASKDETFQKIFFPLVLVGCGVLGAMFPFHSWSPDGHAAAPTAVSMLHAGVLMKVGAFGVLRLGFQMMPEGGAFWAPALVVLGITAALYGAISALKQTDMKLMMGFSSVSHMGYVFLGLGTMNVIGWTGAVLQMTAHGLMTALFFLLIGGMYDQSHNRDIPNFSGMAKQMPIWTIFFVLASLASLGLPGLSGFIAEVHIFIGAFRSYPIVGGLAVLTAAITATYLLRMLSQAFFGEMNPRWTGLKEITWAERAGAAVLAGAILALGLWPAPWIDRIAPSIIQMAGVYL